MSALSVCFSKIGGNVSSLIFFLILLLLLLTIRQFVKRTESQSAETNGINMVVVYYSIAMRSWK